MTTSRCFIVIGPLCLDAKIYAVLMELLIWRPSSSQSASWSRASSLSCAGGLVSLRKSSQICLRASLESASKVNVTSMRDSNASQSRTRLASHKALKAEAASDKRSFGDPSSIRRPESSMSTRSKSTTLLRRWEIMMTVRPWRSSLMTRCIMASVSESILVLESVGHHTQVGSQSSHCVQGVECYVLARWFIQYDNLALSQ